MDQIGILCKSPETGFEVLKIIADEANEGKNETVLPRSTTKQSPRVQPLSLPYLQVMQILCAAELGNNISRYDGIKFGYRAKEYNGLSELYTKSRTEAFGEDVKLAAIIGAMVLSQENYKRYYDKAMRLRRLIKESLRFDDYDVIAADSAVLSRLCGFPSLATPDGVYIAYAGCEDNLATKNALRIKKPEDITA